MSTGQYKSLRSLAESVSDGINKDDINLALHLVHDFVAA